MCSECKDEQQDFENWIKASQNRRVITGSFCTNQEVHCIRKKLPFGCWAPEITHV